MTSILSNTQPTAWVGIDIAKRQNDVLVDRPGHRRRNFRVANRLDDYQNLAKFLIDLPERPVIGFEATGNYHRTLAFFLAEKGFSLRLVSSVAAARTREALYNSRDKNDPKDAQVIIHMLKTGVTQHYHGNRSVNPIIAESDSMRQKRIEIFKHFGSGDSLEDSFEVSPGFEIVRLRGFDETVEVGTGFGAVNRVGEHPVLATDREGTNGVLDEVRVEGHFALLRLTTFWS